MARISFKRLKPAIDPVKDEVPLPRSSHGMSSLLGGKRLMIYGGENVARTPITEKWQSLWFAELRSYGWQWIAATKAIADGIEPPPRVAHAQAAVGEAVYVFGGRKGVDVKEEAMNDMWRMEMVDRNDEGRFRFVRWTRIQTAVGSVVPEARSFHRMISVGIDLYMFGGCGKNGRLNDLWKFDTANMVWTSLGKSHVLSGRGGPNLFSLTFSGDYGGQQGDGGGEGGDGVRIAVVAGFAGEETNDGHVYSSDAWEAAGMEGLEDLRKRSVCAFATLPSISRHVIFGGEVDPSSKGHLGAGSFEQDVVILDGLTGRLMEVVRPERGRESLWPEARGWGDACAGEGGVFYLFGGLTGDDKNPERLNDLWECRVFASE